MAGWRATWDVAALNADPAANGLAEGLEVSMLLLIRVVCWCRSHCLVHTVLGHRGWR